MIAAAVHTEPSPTEIVPVVTVHAVIARRANDALTARALMRRVVIAPKATVRALTVRTANAVSTSHVVTAHKAIVPLATVRAAMHRAARVPTAARKVSAASINRVATVPRVIVPRVIVPRVIARATMRPGRKAPVANLGKHVAKTGRPVRPVKVVRPNAVTIVQRHDATAPTLAFPVAGRVTVPGAAMRPVAPCPPKAARRTNFCYHAGS
jgi:hypothetical protein